MKIPEKLREEVRSIHKLDMADIAILYDLSKSGHISKITAVCIAEINFNRSPKTAHRRLCVLETLGYVARGFSTGRTAKFYITPEGINFLNEAMQ